MQWWGWSIGCGNRTQLTARSICMLYGICLLSVVPVRNQPNEDGALVTQLLYGDDFKIKEQRKHWSRIKISHDSFEGWVSNTQITPIEEATFTSISKADTALNTDLAAHITTQNGYVTPILLGSRVDIGCFFEHRFEGNAPLVVASKKELMHTALSYLNAPYLLGGKTPFGIDCSGFTQMVYKINGYQLFRGTEQQSTQGTPLSFIEESEPGDLAFFDNKEGIIDHVGIILKDNYIIHAHGKVRIDRIDHTGIFNAETKRYSHKLRVIKKII